MFSSTGVGSADGDLKSVPILQDSGKNWVQWSTRVRHLLRARGLFGLVDPNDPVARAMMVAEEAAAKEKKKTKKLVYKQVMGRSACMCFTRRWQQATS